MAYTAAQKAMAIAIYERHGELSKAALDEIRQILELPKLGKTTIFRWVQAGPVPKSPEKTEQNGTATEMEPQKKDAPTVEMVDSARSELHKLYEAVTRRYLARALDPAVVEELDGKQAVTTAAIATDKMRLLLNLPTVIVGILPDLLRNIEAAGYRPEQVLESLNERMMREVKANSEVNLN